MNSLDLLEEQASTARQQQLPAAVRLFWIGSLVTLGLTLLIAFVEYRMGFSRYHYNPLTGDRYQDLMELLPGYRLLHSAAFFDPVGGAHVAYPPFGAVLYAAIYATGHPIAFYLGSAAVWLALCFWGLRSGLVSQGISNLAATLFTLTVGLTSFPIAGLLQRGNIELFLWIFVATGVWLFFRGKQDWAAILWGLAAALKLYPVILLGLFLPRGRWRAFAIGIATFVSVSVGSMVWLGPSIPVAWHGTLQNVFGYQGRRVSEWTLHELMANHTAYHLAKFAALMSGMSRSHLTFAYYGLGALLGVFLFVRLWRMPVANQLLALTAFMVAFPPVSYFYTLVQLYAPWAVLLFVGIKAEKAGGPPKGLQLSLLLFLPLFGSFMLFTFPRIYLYGGLVQGFLLITILLCALSYRFEVNSSQPESVRELRTDVYGDGLKEVNAEDQGRTPSTVHRLTGFHNRCCGDQLVHPHSAGHGCGASHSYSC